jgi:hypothetical protein
VTSIRTNVAGILLVVATAAVIGCSSVGSIERATAAPTPSGSVVVDGFMIGSLAACSGGTDATSQPNSCTRYPALAEAALDARDPGHAAVVKVQTFSDGAQPGPIDVTGDASPPPEASNSIDAYVTVFVFTLADGTIRATGVECPRSDAACKGIGSYPAPSSTPARTMAPGSESR